MAELLRIFVEILGPVALLVAVGVVAGTRLTFDPSTLAKLAYWILGPAFIFNILASADLGPGLIVRVVGATLTAMATTGVLVALAGRLTGRSYEAGAAGVLTSVYGNVGNFGLAIVAFTFGEGALALAGVVLLVVNIVGLIVGVAAASSRGASALQTAKAAFSAPMVLAVPPAVIVNATDVVLPVWLWRPIALLSGALIPVMLLTLGVQLAGMHFPRIGLDMATPIAAKLVLAPALAAVAVSAFGLEGRPAGVVILQSAMPAAVFTALIALEHDLAPQLVTTIVLTGTVLSMATLPLVIFLLA